MIPVGQSYRASGAFDVRGSLALLILGAASGALVAGLVWLWEISPIPTLLIITPILQGIAIGVVLSFVVKRIHLRNPLIAGLIGFCCGAFSIGLVHYGHYLRMIHDLGRVLAERVQNDPAIDAVTKAERLSKIDADPAEFTDRVLQAETGHTGFIGSLYFRNQIGETIKSSKVTGTFLWCIWGAEALAVAGFACAAAHTRAKQPFCEDCTSWCDGPKALPLLPGSVVDKVAEAIQGDDVASVQAAKQAGPAVIGAGVTAVSLHSCSECDQTFATVAFRIPSGRKNEIKETVKARQVRASEAMAAELRAISISPEAPAEPDSDADAKPVGTGEDASQVGTE